MVKKRILAIDILKTIAIIMVISLHVGLLKTDFITNPDTATKIQYAFRLVCEGVPIFVIVNGFLIIHKENFNLKKHVLKILKLFGLVMLWAFILTIVSKAIYKEEIELKTILKYDIFKTNTSAPYAGVLWFLNSLIKLYLFYPLLKVAYDHHRKIYHYFFGAVVFFTIGTDTLYLISDALKQFWNIDYLDTIYTNIDKYSAIGGDKWFVLFFMFGGYLYDCQEAFKRKKVVIISIILGLLSWVFVFYFGYVMSQSMNSIYSNNFAYYTIFMLMFITGLFAIFYQCTGKLKIFKILFTWIGQNTMGIYFTHILVIRALSNYWKPYYTLEFAGRFCVVMAVLLVTTSFSSIVRKIPFIRKLVEV